MPFRGRSVDLQAIVTVGIACTVHVGILEWTGARDVVTSDVVRDWNNGTFAAGQFFLDTGITVNTIHTVACAAWSEAWFRVPATISGSCNNLIVFIWTEPLPQNYDLVIREVDFHTTVGEWRNWNPRPIGEELALCQRYYEKSYDLDTKPGVVVESCWIGKASTPYILPNTIHYKTTKRINRTPIIYSDNNGAANYIAEYNASSTLHGNKAAHPTSVSQAGFRINSDSPGNFSLKAAYDPQYEYYIRWH
jgi:hypothetical protein